MNDNQTSLQSIDDVNRRAVMPRERIVVVEIPYSSRNALQSLSDWWHGGTTAGARSRHMRVSY